MEITVETHQVTIIRTRDSLSVYCEICRAKVQVFSSPQIISLFRLELGEIEQFFQNDQIHFVGVTETICGNSIADYLETNKTKNKKGVI
jgi:hypothetical protein